MNVDVIRTDGSVVSYEDEVQSVRIDSSVKASLHRWHTFEMTADGCLMVSEQTILWDRYYGQGMLEEKVTPLRLFEHGEWMSVIPNPQPEPLPCPHEVRTSARRTRESWRHTNKSAKPRLEDALSEPSEPPAT